MALRMVTEGDRARMADGRLSSAVLATFAALLALGLVALMLAPGG